MSSRADIPRYQRLLSSDRPTDIAKGNFILAWSNAGQANRLLGRLPQGSSQLDDTHRGAWLLASAVAEIAKGLEHLSSGVRATYALLEEVNRKLPK